MITKLTLTNMGKFSSAVFALGKVTAFVGKNEAGKSTVFHALFGILSSGSGSSRNHIKQRYGIEDFKDAVGLEYDSPWDPVEVGVFKNFFAIDTGELSIDFKANARWIKTVQANLFTGGVDPAQCAEGLKGQFSDRANSKYNKNLGQIETNIADGEKTLRELEQLRNDLMAKERRASEGVSEFEKSRSENVDLLGKITELEALLNQQNMIQDLKRWRELKSAIAERKRLEEDLRRLALFASDHIAEAKEAEGNIALVKQKTATQQALIATRSASLKQDRDILDGKKKESISKENLARKAKAFIGEIAGAAPAQTVQPGIQWNKGLVAAGALMIVTGIIAGVLLPGSQWNIVAPLVGVVLGLLVIFIARQNVQATFPSLDSRWLASLKDRWTAETGLALKASTPEGVRLELQTVVNEYDILQTRVADLAEKEISTSRVIGELEETLKKLKSEHDALENDREAWLRRYGVADLEAYRLNIAEYRSAANKLEETSIHITGRSRQAGINADASLESLVDEKIFTLNKNIRDDEILPNELQRKKNDLETLKSRQAKTAEIIAARGRDVGHEEGKVAGALAEIPDQIVSLQSEISEQEKSAALLKLTKEATLLAAEIWEEVASDSEAMFSDLSADMAGRFREITQYADADGTLLTTINALSSDEIKVRDAAGGVRSIDHLSSATYDAFYLAARLSLALRMKEENSAGIFLLDDPFVTFDEKRAHNAIKSLKIFQEISGWQMVFFTKDRQTLLQLQGAFSGLRVNDLDQI